MKQSVFYTKDLNLLPGEIINTNPAETPLVGTVQTMFGDRR